MLAYKRFSETMDETLGLKLSLALLESLFQHPVLHLPFSHDYTSILFFTIIFFVSQPAPLLIALEKNYEQHVSSDVYSSSQIA